MFMPTDETQQGAEQRDELFISVSNPRRVRL